MRDPLKRAWHRLRGPSTRWSVLALVTLGLVVGAIATIGTQVMVHVTGTDEFCGAACHSMQWVAKELPGEHPWREPHRDARDVP